jgi:hypothetical protein
VRALLVTAIRGNDGVAIRLKALDFKGFKVSEEAVYAF